MLIAARISGQGKGFDLHEPSFFQMHNWNKKKVFEKQRKGKEQSFNVRIREQQLMLSSSAGVLEDLKKKKKSRRAVVPTFNEE